MDMVSFNILMLVDHIGHIGKPHLLHILVCQTGEVSVTELVIGMRIERDVHHRPLGAR